MNITSLLVAIASCAPALAKDNRVLLPPFENLSSRRAPTEYVISAGGLSARTPTRNLVDRYSHVPREILEDIVSHIKGVRPVERQRLDQFFFENGLDNPQTLVDREKAKLVMIKLNAPTAVQGTILSISDGPFEYNGYVAVKGHRWSATVRVRIYNLVDGNLEIPYSKVLSSSYNSLETPFTKDNTAEQEIALILLTKVLDQLRGDLEFETAVRDQGKPHELSERDDGFLKVPFDIIPDGTDVYVDDIWRGKSPCIVRMEASKEAVVRLEKAPTHETWQAKVLPERGFRVNRDLQLLTLVPEKGAK